MSFTMLAPAAIASRMSSGLRVSTEIGTPQPASASSTGSTRRRSSSSATGIAPGPRRLAADVEDIRAFGDQRPRVRDCGAHAGVAAAVGKGIGRDVDDAHDEGPVECELVAPH